MSRDRLATTTRQIVGTELIGAKGATPKDQDQIDDTVAGLCGAGSYRPNECETHQRLTEPPRRATGSPTS